MFRLESYITPILLSYVDRYIKNFKLENSQLSLWGGDANFHNLDLRLEVLEQELQLPFSLVSGHIRELLIHVPWTKLASEPITITINTIECILKLRGSTEAASAEPNQTKEKSKRPSTARQDLEAPPSYVQLLINKIVSNIRIYCNNLILKYVEEDIVLSMNVKLLKFESADEKWNPAYTDLSPGEVTLRKIIQVNDLTLCLDKRNAAGKIDVYQEPMLYRCSMTMHILRNYHAATANKSSTTRFDIYCNNMEFGMTEQQVPMLMRLIMLLQAVQQKQFKEKRDRNSDNNIQPDQKETSEDAESWTGWAWSYVSAVLPTPWDENWDSEQLRNQTGSGHIVHTGFYVDNLSITFKVSEFGGSERSGYYSQKKVKYWPMLVLKLQSIYSESIIHGMKWFNASFGIGQAILLPVGICSCSFEEVADDMESAYLKIGSSTSNHKVDSLFDAEAVENQGKKRDYNTSWDYHMVTVNESSLLERTAALAFDYLYKMEVPDDMSSEMLSEIGSDFEYTNLSEISSLRLYFGSLKLKLCSGLFHRLSSLQMAASQYDYPPYSQPKPVPSLEELPPPSEEDYDALNEFISNRTIKIAFFKPVIEIQLADHPYFVPSKNQLFKKRKKLSKSQQTNTKLPKLTIECQFFDIYMQYPMYANRLVYTTCQLPDPPAKLFNACYKKLEIKIMGFCSKLILNSKYTTLLSPFCMSYINKTILKPQYWKNANIPHVDVTVESEMITINGTQAKMVIAYDILQKLFFPQADYSLNFINNTSLLSDASKDFGLPYLELCIEEMGFKKVTTNSTVTIDIKLRAIKAFIFECFGKCDCKHGKTCDCERQSIKSTDDIQQVLFISGPDPSNSSETLTEDLPLFTAVLQYPLDPEVQRHPPILIFNLQEMKFCVDPLLCKFLLYSPKKFRKEASSDAFYRSKPSEASGSVFETPQRKLSSQLESVHSSSDREPQVQIKKIAKVDEQIDIQEKIYNMLKTWFDVWKGMLLYGDVSQCTIYFPMTSLSAVGSQGIQEAVENASQQENPPDIMVIALPFANVRSAQRQNISKYLNKLPVGLPDTIWSIDKSSFPWTMSISELSCYTIQGGEKLIFLRPVSLSATVGLSTRPAKSDLKPDEDLGGSKSDIGYLGVCVHIDMSPVQVCTSEIQVYLFASILYGLMEVLTNLMPSEGIKVSKTPEINPICSNLSPTIVKETNTLSSNESPALVANNTENIDTEGVKLTAWVQWTITRFTIELLSTALTEDKSRLKLVIDAEDIVSSLDFQSVYLKIKSKIGSISIQHFKEIDSKWKAGPFSGIVMRLRDDINSQKHRHEDNGFISVTITRASCKHTHTLWGAAPKSQNKENLLSSTRYITEIVVNVQPIDFIISLRTLKSFYMVILPLLQINGDKPKEIKSAGFNFSNQTLPLAYLECQDIRVIIPSYELSGSGLMHDVFILQLQKLSLSPTAVNPICRSPLRPDIYEQAAHARILNIPGSEVEDRQYQFDILGMSLTTSTWEDINTILSPTKITSNLRGMSENPALEWNNLELGQPMAPILNLWQISEKINISIVAAPAMIYKESTLICGNSVEVNFVSDIFVNLSLQQIQLASALCDESKALFEPCSFDRKQQITLPYSRFRYCEEIPEEGEVQNVSEVQRDSGIDTSDIRSVLSAKHCGNSGITKAISDCDRYRSSLSSIPAEVLFTAGVVSLSLYQVENYMATGRNKKKKKCAATKKLETEDCGYEASEESMEERSDALNSYIPLIFLSLIQPNAYLSKYQLGSRIQISCYDIHFRLSESDFNAVNHIPTESDFILKLVETKSGVPNESTGILPAIFTLKYDAKNAGKVSNLEVEVAKPIKLICETNKWLHLLNIKDRILDALQSNTIVSQTVETDNLILENTFIKFQNIRDLFHNLNCFNLKLDQLIFAIKSHPNHELHIGFEKLNNQLTINSRPEKICNTCNLQSITTTVIINNRKKLLLNPWSLSIDICLFWEAWQAFHSDPQVQISVESDCLIVDLSPENIHCVEIVISDLNDFISSLKFNSQTDNSNLKKKEIVVLESRPKNVLISNKSILEDEVFDQHYKDDLRAGAFQFVDSSNSSNELPLPYQVMFWNQNILAMAWRYPQPRALTKVRVFPVPYKSMNLNSDDLQVLCHLEYWSEVRNCYLPFTQFYLSESEVCHLSLPEVGPKPIVASTWRVVINVINDSDSAEGDDLKNSVPPRALAACMRIDSYFNKSFVPSLSLAFYLTKFELNFYTYNCKNEETLRKLPKILKNYHSDMQFPQNHNFLTLTVENAIGHFSTWNLESFIAELTSSVKVNVLDYAFLTSQSLVDPFINKIEVIFNENKDFNINLISRPVNIIFSPSIAHTLAVSAQLWSQNLRSINCSTTDFILVSRFIICNNTNSNIRFGQAQTDEDILLPPQCFHQYCWRSQKRPQYLKLAMEESEWVWSRPFSLLQPVQNIFFNGDNKKYSMFVFVKQLSATQVQITICGQLTVCNMLTEHFEFKVVETAVENKDVAIREAKTHIAPGKNAAASIFLNNTKGYYLRLRFYGLESAWTGDIPIREHSNGAQPWLVKVPLQERGQFLSIWCRIVVQEIQKTKRYLAILWPLFTVKSNLPGDSKVVIETPSLNVKLDAEVQGKGVVQQLYCPGTIDHSHQLSFQLEKNSTSNPYVPLNYSLVDQSEFFKRNDKLDIEDVLKSLLNGTASDKKWPYFGDELDDIDWIIESPQSLTHVQVRYQNSCEFSSSLMVELLPWCLMVNTLGVPVAILFNGVELCRLQHNGIVAPPKMEENFHIGICLKENTWNYSGPLQLAKSDWTQAFYMPKITGTIPLEGFIKVSIVFEQFICLALISSSICNDIRLLKVSSTHVLTNHLDQQLNAVCLVVPDNERIYQLPKELDEYMFTLQPNLHKSNSGLPIIKWLNLDGITDFTSDLALYITFSSSSEYGWSCPIRIDKQLLRKSFSIPVTHQKSLPVVLTSQENKGQLYLSLCYDTRPQIYLENFSQVSLVCAQSLGNDQKVAVESQHFFWHCEVLSQSCTYYTMPIISDKFPELAQNSLGEKIVFAAALEADRDHSFPHFVEEWSAEVNISSDNEQFIRIPHFGDIKLTISNTACTTILTIESVSQVEISARDIRVRLSMHETDPQSSTSINVIHQKHKCAAMEAAEKRVLKATDDAIKLSKDQQRPLKKTNLGKIDKKSLLRKTIDLDKLGMKSLKTSAFLKSFNITFLNGADRKDEISDLACFNCDNIAFCLIQEEGLNVKFSASDIQFDNQLYSRESFDFPVVLIGQETKPPQKLSSISVPIDELINSATDEALLMVQIIFDSFVESTRNEIITAPKCVKITLNPISCYVEDVYMTNLMDYLKQFIPINLVVWPDHRTDPIRALDSAVFVPELILWQCSLLARPLTIRTLSISPLSILLSVHCSVKIYIALDESPLQFAKFDRRRLLTTPYRLGHSLTMHYLSGAIFRAGWVVSSLELLGNPGGLARAMGSGLRDFVSLPYRGLIQGPWAFLRGITTGSASLMRHVTAGTLQSVTKLASSVARNLDRLTLDEEHLRRTEEQRRQKPQGLTQGFMQGLTGLGISLLGAVGGIAHHPLQSVMAEGASPRSLAAGVGLGLVGVITKPLSGAAELVALTGQGLLQGAGWNSLPAARSSSQSLKLTDSNNSTLKYSWKVVSTMSDKLLFATEATTITNGVPDFDSIILILTMDALILVNSDEDAAQRILTLNEITLVNNEDPTCLTLKLTPPLIVSKLQPKEAEDALVVEMDPACRARVADYVKSTVIGLLNLPEVESVEHSEISISPLSSPEGGSRENLDEPITILQFYVNPQSKNYFISLLQLAKQQHQNYNFPVL